MKLFHREMADEHVVPEEYFDPQDDDSGKLTLVIQTSYWEELGRPEEVNVEVSTD